MALTKAHNRMIAGSAVSALDFGADPTGSADSTSAIQAALNSGSNKVIIPAGRYLTTSSIIVPSKVNVEGMGIGVTIIDCQIASVSAPQGIAKSSAFRFKGTCADDDYTTFFNSTGDYFVSSARPFAAASTYAAGSNTIVAANSADVADLQAGDWLHISEGLAAWHPAKSEFAQVASIAGTTITLSQRLRNSYSNTATSLGQFVRDYTLTSNPGGGGAGYPDMSTWEDSGFRKVSPVVNASLRNLTVDCNHSGGVTPIGWFSHIAVNCSVDIEIKDGVFWQLDGQDADVTLIGGQGAVTGNSSYLCNGVNGVRANINYTGRVQVEEGGQNITGVISSTGYSTLKRFCKNVDLIWFGSASGTPALEMSTSATVKLTPYLYSNSNGYNVSTPTLWSVATDLPETFLSTEVIDYYFDGGQLIGGECKSSANAGFSIASSNGITPYVKDTTVPSTQTTRYKGAVLVDGVREFFEIADVPLYWDLQVGDDFYSESKSKIRVVGNRASTIFSQNNWPTDKNRITVNDVTADGGIDVGDIIVFKVSDTATPLANWEYHVAQVTQINKGTKELYYSPDSTKIAAASPNHRINSFRLDIGGSTSLANQFQTRQSGFNAKNAAGVASGAPLILGEYHLWVDTTGDLRIKNGAPTSDTDGTVVGTQS